ncbi:MAG: hypothetical protein RL497_1135 [Pseudomonadota bacterium]|jgi:TonB family protein
MLRALHILLCSILLLSASLPLKTFAAEPVLNGVAIYSELGSEQFVAGLYTSKVTSDSKAILLDTGDQRMEVRVLAGSLLGNRFKRMWIEGVAINAGMGEMAKNSQHLADFNNLLSIKLQRDDVLSVLRQGDSTIVRLNNIELGKIASGDFYNLLLRTWIGPVPLSSTFRDGLLTAGKMDDKTISIYSKINPTPERIAVVKAALIAAAKNKGKPVEIAAVKDPAIKTDPSKLDPAKLDPAKETAKIEPTKPSSEKIPANPVPAIASTAATTTAAVTSTVAVTAANPPPAVPAPTSTPAKPATTASAVKPNEVFDDGEKQETADSLLVQQLYISKLSKRTAGFVKYPKSALSKEQEGTVRLSITINRSGQVLNVKSSSTNEIAVLTDAAVDAANKSSPYPAIPEQIKTDVFTFTIPITFRVKDK